MTDNEGPEGEYRNSSTLSLTSVLDWFGWSVPRPGRFTPGKEIGGWVGPSVGLDRCGKYTTGRRSPDPPAHTESLYRLSYPGPPGWYVAIMLTDATVEYWHWTFNRSHSNTVPAADWCYRGNCHTLYTVLNLASANGVAIHLITTLNVFKKMGLRGGTAGWGTALQAGKSRIRFSWDRWNFSLT